MSLGATDAYLLRVSKAKEVDLGRFKEGVYLEATSGRPIDDLHSQACADRMRLARGFCESADRLMRSRPPMFRVAVGRYYYAIYHAMRAVVYFRTPGDDHEQHSVLAGKAPSDFPDLAFWKNELKYARLRRNEADYDPYPFDDSEFRESAATLKKDAHSLLTEASSYLRLKGCAYL